MKISLPVYSKVEEVINSMTHGVGAVLSLIGTFTPVCLIALSDKIGIVYFYIIWLITIIGTIINIIDVDKCENISLILHLIMG